VECYDDLKSQQEAKEAAIAEAESLASEIKVLVEKLHSLSNCIDQINVISNCYEEIDGYELCYNQLNKVYDFVLENIKIDNEDYNECKTNIYEEAKQSNEIDKKIKDNKDDLSNLNKELLDFYNTKYDEIKKMRDDLFNLCNRRGILEIYYNLQVD